MQIQTDDKGILINDSEFVSFWVLALKRAGGNRKKVLGAIKKELLLNSNLDPDYGFFVFREIIDRAL